VGDGDFEALVRAATRDAESKPRGDAPYPYQRRLAEEGLPDLIRVPTGAGKTLAATLPWLYRRRFHPDPAVRHATPRRLVLVLPQRSLVEQTRAVVERWLDRLRDSDDRAIRLEPEIKVHVLLGGASTDDRRWKMDPAAEAVLVGTQDMVLSRLLMRGYGEPRSARPVAFGLLHADTQFVFDEVQLMGPGLPTSLQLAGLREALGTATPCRSTWMSATVDERRFADLPDFGGIRTVIGLGDVDRTGPLARRLDATRAVARLQVDPDPRRYAAALAGAVLARHRGATRTLVVLNTVERAAQVYDAILQQRPTARVVLLHSRFRPGDRAERTAAALADPSPEGLVVVSTQVLEAGVDVTSRLLVTEVAPWSSIVQRAGRCNRGGEHGDAELLWTSPPTGPHWAMPYDEKDLARTAEALGELEGVAVTSTLLQERAVEEEVAIHPVLRRADLLDLFDTAPDLFGNDLDVGRWIRDADVVTADVAWREYSQEPPEDAPAPARDELCAAPLGSLRDLLKGQGRRAWVYDQVEDEWRHAGPEDVRPGATLVLDARQGSYLADRGWTPASTAPVPPLPVQEADLPDGLAADNLTVVGRAVTLADHSEDVRREAARLLSSLGDLPGLSRDFREATERAGLYHDLGKAHEVFVASLHRVGVPDAPGPWAKSAGRGRLHHDPPTFRHELVSALMVLDPASGLLDSVAEPDLVAYLVAAHHGKVRLAVRSAPADRGDRVLGVGREERTPEVALIGGRTVPPLTLRRDVLEVGGAESGVSWTARACRLRDRDDLGPFRLAFLEAIVRMADWRASRSYEEGQ
jgi:CRISPR-associated endonuclease/helicase Cas3